MKNIWVACAAFAAAFFTPEMASAQTITFTGSSATDGIDGNVRTFASGGIQVQASAWSFDGSTLEQAYLGAYANGLGVTNNGEGNGSTGASHAVDNYGQTDFILLFFNQSVNVSSARLTPYDVSSTADDNDAMVARATFAHPFTASPTPVTVGSALWTALFANDYTVAGNMTSPYSTSLNSAGSFGNFWIVGAALTNPDRNDDGFKLTSVNVTAAVPEPSTWAMMLLGFGTLGFALRRRCRAGGLLQVA